MCCSETAIQGFDVERDALPQATDGSFAVSRAFSGDPILEAASVGNRYLGYSR